MKKIATLLATLCLFQSAYAATAVPDAISYQGRALTATGALMGAGTPVNRTVTFRIWDHASNSLTANLIYSEQQVVTIAEGEFSVLVGTGAATAGTPLGYSETAKGLPTVKVSAAFGGVTRYLGVTIDDGTAAVDNEISPRQQFVTSTYAMRAKVAEGVDGLAITTAMLANNSVTTTQVGDAAITSSKLAANAVTATQIVDATITSAKLAANAVTATQIVDATITGAKLATGAVTSTAILDGTIVDADIGSLAAGKITAGTLADARLSTNVATLSGTQSFTGAKSFTTKVGIGTASPSNYLSVEGGGQVATASTSTAVAHFGGADVHTYFGSYDGASGYATWMQAMRPSDQLTFPVAINPNGGNVGIGTATPAYKLDVAGTAHVTGDLSADSEIRMPADRAIYGKNTAGVSEPAFWPRSGNGTYIQYGTNGLTIRNNAAAHTMTMTNDNKVQIGTAGTMGRLNIGTAQANYNRYGGLGSDGGSSSNFSRTNQALSISADGGIYCSLVDISSDTRIKTALHPTDSAKDLQTLMAIQITDYQFKDTVTNGNAPQKKVIAQQVEPIFPQAVSIRQGIVPDIYKNAQVKDHWVMLTTDLKVGEKVRMITLEGESLAEVLEVRSDSFRTALQPAEGKAFVYGREVKDFHSVDYDAIAMLNVSATQQVARELKTVQDENAGLRRELAALRSELAAKDQTLEARLIALEARQTKGSPAVTVSLKTAAAAR